MSQNRKITLIAMLLFATWSCYTVPSQPVLGYETGDESCQDHQDNDHDGLVDCQDPDCRWTSGQCGEIIPRLPFDPKAENTAARCRDGIDNDLDGTFDCGDRNCQSIAELCCVTEFTNDRCSDGKDNDNNGFADCADYGCLHGKFVTVCQETTDAACKDGKDNDGDKLKDCEDSDCQKLPLCKIVVATGKENTFAFCTDKGDNDDNTYMDCNDNNCKNSKEEWPGHAGQTVSDYCKSVSETTYEKCSDKIDNDGSRYVDCADYSCSKSSEQWPAANGGGDGKTVADYCLSLAETSFAKCTDKKDNDGNGYVDCADRACSGSTESWAAADGGGDQKTVAMYCTNLAESTFAKCTDGLDNDKNGYADCQDNSCSGALDVDTRQACQESIGDVSGTADDKCKDGKDNDLDGATDCDDWDCSWNPNVTVCNNKKKVCGP